VLVCLTLRTYLLQAARARDAGDAREAKAALATARAYAAREGVPAGVFRGLLGEFGFTA
jgi:hypothetical protein